ncbi:RHS repeat-associated core domain-containing protein [Chitinophaga sp.]|uniref:RHS repeat-associated core domain-containing protein n=1 Tax=Chitinophaga sp. TaxID=1869181 RepID=UPI0031D18C7D
MLWVNGKESDIEVKEDGNRQDYRIRIYDPSVGKFLSVDPLRKSYPELTPYQFASNTPIEGIDLDGGDVRHIQMFRGQMYESLASDAIRHPIPSGAYLPSNGAATGGSANARRGFIAAGTVVIGVVAAPTVGLMAESGFWRIALWGSLPQNQMLVAEGITFTAGALNPGPDDISPGSSSNKLGGYARQTLLKVPRFAKKLLGTNSQIHVLGLHVWEGPDAIRYLEGKAKAAYMAQTEGQGIMILGANPRRREIAEEILHHEQLLKYGKDYFTSNPYLMEVEAQNILLKIGKDEKWSKKEMDEIIRARETWTKKLENSN